MTGHDLAIYRKQKNRTQVQTAKALGVSQTYLSLLETGMRPLPPRLQKKAAGYFSLPPTELPSRLTAAELPQVSDADLAADLADLGYPGFSHLQRKRRRLRNPADVLLTGLNTAKRDARIVEAFPWLVVAFRDMDWNDVARTAKMYDLQNRLGYVLSVARIYVELRDGHAAGELQKREAELGPSMLAREDTLCNDTMTNAERKWLADNRPANARRWNMLADLRPEHLNHYE